MPTRKASSALFSRIAEVALKELNRSDLYVAQAPAGQGLTVADLELLQQAESDRMDDPESLSRLVNLSRLVDCIQLSSEVISPPTNGPYISHMYPMLVKNVKFFTAPLSDSDKQQYEQAQAVLYQGPPFFKFFKTADYQRFCMLRSDVEKQEVALIEMQQNLQRLPDSSTERDVLKNELNAAQQLCTEKEEELESLDQLYNFTTAEDIVERAERRIDEMPASYRSMVDLIETPMFQIANASNHDVHVGCSFFPSHLAESNWIPLDLTSEDISHGQDAGQNTPTDPSEIDDSQIDSIELQIQTLICDRPWLWQSLFENRHWEWDIVSPPISTGNENWGESDWIPAYIYALVFARNLIIRTRSSEQPAGDRSKSRRQLHSGWLGHVLATSIGETPQLYEAVIAQSDMAISQAVMTPTLLQRQSEDFAEVAVADRIATVEYLHNNLDEILKARFVHNLGATGQIVDEQGHGIYQASVTLANEAGQSRVMTGQDGSFIFPTLATGEYRVHVEKYGFIPVDRSITVPQAASETIRISQAASCQVLVHLQLPTGQPFIGAVKVLIQMPDGQRLESMDQRSEANFALPPGDFTISVTSPEAEQISPASAPVSVPVDCSERPILTFTITLASTVQFPDIQLLGIVCRKVPRCPDPER